MVALLREPSDDQRVLRLLIDLAFKSPAKEGRDEDFGARGFRFWAPSFGLLASGSCARAWELRGLDVRRSGTSGSEVWGLGAWQGKVGFEPANLQSSSLSDA